MNTHPAAPLGKVPHPCVHSFLPPPHNVSSLDENTNKLPLVGVRVLDMSRLLPGPYCTQILADLGADVIKIEDPTTFGDYLRLEAPLLPDNQGAFFHLSNRGKRSISLDLRETEGQATFTQLLTVSDVLIESYRPGAFSKITGYSFAQLAKRFPHLIICSITGFGQTGEMAHHAGHDLNFLAESGLMGMMDPPVVLPGVIGDLLGGSYPAVIQILAALYRRIATPNKEGCFLDISIANNSRAAMCLSAAATISDPNPREENNIFLPHINRSSGILAGYTVYRTKDGYMSAGGTEEKFWQNLLTALDLPQVPMPTPDDMAANKKIMDIIQQRLETKTTSEWESIIHAKGMDGKTCFNRVQVPTADWFIREQEKVHQIAKVDIIPRKPKNKESAERQTQSPIKTCLPGTPLSPNIAIQSSVPAPRLGQHTDEILKELQDLKIKSKI